MSGTMPRLSGIDFLLIAKCNLKCMCIYPQFSNFSNLITY